MYIIIEGMPSSGKSTLAKSLAEKYRAVYFKSLLPNDMFGNQIRVLRDAETNEATVDLLHLVDLFRNELHIGDLLRKGHSVIRDKCFLSSLAHVLAVSTDMSPELRYTLLMGYEELCNNMVQPDALVLLNRSLTDSRKMSLEKGDLTALDHTILSNQERYIAQQMFLNDQARKYFGEQLILLSGNLTLAEKVRTIEEGMAK